ncbi:MAG: proton-conducting transporter membrane subunit [Chloroflexota bacterium]|nr:proton-conducting transporter membrane subunit [Chloroflexota bacterium]
MTNALLLAPIFIPLGGAALGILLARNRTYQQAIGIVCSIGAWIGSIALLIGNLDGSIFTYNLGGWAPPYGIVLVADLLASLFAVMATTVMAAGMLYAVGCRDKSVSSPAFMPLFLCMAAGLNGVLYTGDIFTMFVFIELMVISSVILVAISDNRLGMEAAIKYLFISSMGTLFLLTGIAALYATFGTLNMADIARLLASGERPVLAQAAAVMLMCAFLLKSAVFPFHFWQPDFHTTAPTPVGAMLSSIIVKVGIYGLIRMITLMFTAEAALIGNVLVILGIIGIFFGSLGALRTYDAKRLLAYSTFGQVGFILVGIGWGSPAALAAALVYAVNHSFIKSSMLMITGVISSRTMTKTARLTELGGVGKTMPWVGGLYLVGGLALAGVPPLNGFISKVTLVQSGIEAQEWLTLGLVVAAGALTLLYITRTWQLIFLQDPDEALKLKPYGDSVLAPSLLIALCVTLGVFASPLISLALRAVEQMGDPTLYIRAVLGG